MLTLFPFQLKNSIDSMKKVAMATGVPIPDDLTVELMGGNDGISTPGGPSITSFSTSKQQQQQQQQPNWTSDNKKYNPGIGLSGSKDDLSDFEIEDKAQGKGGSNKSGPGLYKSALSDDDGDLTGKVQPPTLANSINLSTLNVASMSASEKARK
jgi:hypothetical protein